jgi:hypothetical protein
MYIIENIAINNFFLLLGMFQQRRSKEIICKRLLLVNVSYILVCL